MAKSVGLVLGSGGARGWAHIGVIRALEEANIRVQYVAGASVGALVGSIYAAGELDDLEEFVRSLDWRTVVSYFDVVFPHSGLLDGNRVYDLISDHLRDMQIETADVKFCCVATDLLTGKEERLQSGDMVDAVRASISIPGVFTPFQKGDRFFGDGGVINPIPVDVAKDMGAEVIIAVNLNHVSPTADQLLDRKNGEHPVPDPSDTDEPPNTSEQPSAESSSATEPEDATPDENEQPINLLTRERPEPPPVPTESTTDETPSANTTTTDADEGESAEPTDREADPSIMETLQTTSETAQSQISTMMNQIQNRYEQVQDQVQDKLETWMPDRKEELNIFDVIGTSLNVMEQQVARSRLEACPPDLLVEPSLGEYGIFDFHQAELIIQEGYRCMKALLPELEKILSED